jgi:alcohol dehydrogenase
MLAVHLADGKVRVRRAPRPKRPDGFSLIRLMTGGLCNTDLELLRGYYGFAGTPGHEFVGEVVESDSPDLLGRRVVGEINLACGRCQWCRRGLGRHCPARTVLGIVKHPGAFRELFTLPDVNLHVVPREVPSDHAVFVEPLAAACEILDQAAIPAGATVAVLGDGKLGLLVSQALRARGYEAHLFGRHRAKLRIAERADIETVVVGGNPRLPAAAYDWTVEATGSRDGLAQAVAMTRPRGTVFMKSTVHRAVPLDTAPVIVNEVTLVGSRCGRFEPALELLREGRVNVADMISDRYPLARAPRAFRAAAARGALKVLLTVP